jgi:glutamate racemase
VFDSGIGGLSVLKALRAELPLEDFVYVADSAYAPYGERAEAEVIERAHLISACLLAQHHIKALVIACNTATAVAIHLLRQAHPQLALIGLEPALKPALAQSQTRRIGVMATRGTLGSAKFQALIGSLRGEADFIYQPCDGLATAIEHQDTSTMLALCASYTGAIGQFGTNRGQIDTLVLGCTHYPLVCEHLARLVGADIKLIDSGEPVARQTRRRLPDLASGDTPGRCTLISTGDGGALQQAARHWLGIEAPVLALSG